MSDPQELWSGSLRARLLARCLAGIGGLGYVVLCILDVGHDGWSALEADLSGGVLLVLFFVGLGTLLSLRQPANPIGWLLTAGGLTWLTNALAESVAKHALADSQSVTVATGLAAAFNQNIWVLGVLCSVGLPLLLFPAGRTRSPRWQWVLRVMVTACALFLFASIVSPAPVVSPLDPKRALANPWGVGGLEAVSTILKDTGLLLLMGSMLLAVAGIALRFRSASGAEREQLRWVRYGASLAVGGMLTVFIGTGLLGLPSRLTDIAVTVGIGSLPVTFTVAILRYRLYDLDRVVSRTVTYTTVTGMLVGTYVGIVTAVSRLTPSGNTLAVAASTLTVAALFQPLRRRVQHAVDRRFNRARFDAERTVNAFSRLLRDEVDLDVVRAEMLAVAHLTMQPVSATLWLRHDGGGPP